MPSAGSNATLDMSRTSDSKSAPSPDPREERQKSRVEFTQDRSLSQVESIRRMPVQSVGNDDELLHTNTLAWC
jgi:hypothetical protein